MAIQPQNFSVFPNAIKISVYFSDCGDFKGIFVMRNDIFGF